MSGSAASDGPRIFVSHSHEDDDYCRAFVEELRRLWGERDAVWYDEHNMGAGQLGPTIERELIARPMFVVILSPSALASGWVEDEARWAYELYRKDRHSRIILPVLATPISEDDIWLFLRGFRRIEAPGMQPYPPAEAARRTYAALTGMQVASAPAHVPMPGKPEPAPAPIQPHSAPAAQKRPESVAIAAPARPILPRDRFPKRLEQLGFVAEMGRDPDSGKEVPFIRPPLCPVPAGPFLMGSDPEKDREARPNEQPQHEVTLPAYQIGKFPVTVAEYVCFVAAGHTAPDEWGTQRDKLDHPVVRVT